MPNIFDNLLKLYVTRFPVNKGKSKLIQYAASTHPHGFILTKRTGFGALMQLDLSQYVDANIYYRNIYEKNILETIKSLQQKYSLDFMLDIGANIGQHSLFGAISCGLNVISFEANPNTFQKLKKNIQLNNMENRIIPLNLALSDSSCMVDIIDDDAANCGKAYISEANHGDSTSNSVHAVRLDDYITSDNFRNTISGKGLIKIDVEGSEGKVLRGAKNILCSGKIKAVIAEIISDYLKRFDDNPQVICRFMMDCGFNPYKIFDKSTRPLDCNNMPNNGDILFLRE